MRSVETERSLQRVEMELHALALWPDDFAALGEADRQSRARAADRQADAAELSPKPTVEIEKSEVQPRRRRDGHLRHRRRRLMLQLGLLLVPLIDLQFLTEL